MKKVISLVLSVALAFNLSLATVFAAESQDNSSPSKIITFEEYYNTVQAAFAQRGVEWEGVQTDDTFVYTEALLNESLQYVSAFCDAQANKEVGNQTLTDEAELFTSDSRAVMYQTYAMSTSYTVLPSFHETLIPRTAKVQINANIDTELLNYYIMKGNTPTLSLSSATGYADYILLKSYSNTYRNNNSTDATIFYQITCELKEETSVGGVTSWAKVDETFTVSFKPFR